MRFVKVEQGMDIRADCVKPIVVDVKRCSKVLVGEKHAEANTLTKCGMKFGPLRNYRFAFFGRAMCAQMLLMFMYCIFRVSSITTTISQTGLVVASG